MIFLISTCVRAIKEEKKKLTKAIKITKKDKSKKTK
jgi:hypothetical protein